MSDQRDTQRQRVYDAEDAAFGLYFERPTACYDSLNLQQMQALVDKWCSSKVLQRRYPRAKRPPTVTDGRSRRRAAYDPGTHQLRHPRFSRNKWMLMHELAHALVYPVKPWHGWEFCECYLYLVRVFAGRGSEELLREQFKAHRVKYRPPRKSRMTAEQRAAARQRMLDLHARRKEATAA